MRAGSEPTSSGFTSVLYKAVTADTEQYEQSIQDFYPPNFSQILTRVVRLDLNAGPLSVTDYTYTIVLVLLRKLFHL